MQNYEWYQKLLKPSWAPPSRVFGPVWTFLYVLIAISFGFVFYQAAVGQLSFWIVLPFSLNLIFNFAFTPIQFGLKNNALAATDVILVLVTLVFALSAIFPAAPWVVYINIPYLLWVAFATVLQLTITKLNRKQ